MEFTSILDLKESPYKEGGRPAFFLDLNLNQIIERINILWEKNVDSYYYYFPADAACEDYRRAIYADIKQGKTFNVLCEFSEQMQEWEEAQRKGAAVRLGLQKEAWYIKEAGCYCDAFLQLSRELEELPIQSPGMCSFRSYLKEYLDSEAFKRLYENVCRLREETNRLRLVFTYENDRITVAMTEMTAGAYNSFLQESFPGQNRKMKNPFDVNLDLSELEQELLKIVQKINPNFFKEMKRFYKEFKEYASEVLLRFVSEIEFYLSFYCFEQYMREKDFVFAAPERTNEQEMSAFGLYDLALACAFSSGAAAGTRGKVIDNNMSYEAGEQFFVLTGPNQGGKTTFARSLGQLVYFAKMGLDVPAKSAIVPYFSDILTHFSVEESVETGRGKLKEELVRLAPMMDDTYTGAFVIINELFTTAANYDACIMGKRVLEHFLAQGCRGIYVTHLKELAEPADGIVSIRAMLDENGKQSFEIVRSVAEESANAINQVNKYRLTYAQLKERLS